MSIPLQQGQIRARCCLTDSYRLCRDGSWCIYMELMKMMEIGWKYSGQGPHCNSVCLFHTALWHNAP